MAISESFSPRKHFLAFLLVTIAAACSSHANPSIKASRDLLNFVCSRSSNPPLCLQVLSSDPRSRNATLKDLGFISLDAAESQAKTTQTLIGSLLQKATDPKLKAQLKSCQGFYDDSIKQLDQGRNALNAGNPRGSGGYVSAANADADSCDEGFAGSSTPEPSELQDADQKFEVISGITLIVTAFLLLPPPSH
ncbi:pectinesterase inhibitor-like [Coffea arabica]|uniref:Pectinesterase inhibitor-like n=1 Tax=Coffea arabica TaxID=13443 RepID=A0A6P6U050_COFAR|nr:pectinesterase inhibitor-like [Coffea arabica]